MAKPLSACQSTIYNTFRCSGTWIFNCRGGAFFVELYPESVFSVGIRSVFLGNYHTDTEGKLGRYISVSKRGQCPPFSSKGGQRPPFWEDQPPFGKKGGRKGGTYTKKGGTIPTEIPKIQQIWYRQNTDTEKTAGNTAILFRQMTLFFMLPNNIM